VEIDVGPFMAPGPTSAATSGLPPRGDLAGRRHTHHRIGEAVTGDGNGWVHCRQGHRHWGRFGAAGLLVTDGARVVLQHRSEWTHEGGTWALPGGARDSHEDPVTAALREAAEEAALDPADVAPFREWVDEHGGWSYTTVLARAVGPLNLAAINFESTAIQWWDLAEVPALPLHAGFAAAWPSLRDLLGAAQDPDRA
jgi:8-oxo-dGTP diphosphatase